MSTVLFHPPLQEKVQMIWVKVDDPNFAFQEKGALRISDAVRKLAVLSPGFFQMQSEVQRDFCFYFRLYSSHGAGLLADAHHFFTIDGK